MHTLSKQDYFDRLLLLPLFQGIGRSEFTEIAERVRIGFSHIRKEYVIARQDDLCTQLHFVLHGEVRICRESDSHDFSLTEWQNQPMVVQPEVLFGLCTRYSRTYITATPAEFLVVDKATVRDLLFNYPTFRINYLNMVSTQVQQAQRQLWLSSPGRLEARFARFVTARSLRPAGRKQLKIKRTLLAHELHTVKPVLGKALAALATQGLVHTTRGYIDIPLLEQLLKAIH